MDEGKSCFNGIGIVRSVEWNDEAKTRADEYIKGHKFPLSCFLTRYLSEHHLKVYLSLPFNRSLYNALAGVADLFVHLGYVKGLMDGEDRALRDDKLRKMIDGDSNEKSSG